MTSPDRIATAGVEKRPGTDIAMECVREALLNLRFGSVAITVHDGRVVQIDVTEKNRLISG